MPTLLNEFDAARVLDISTRQVARMVRSGELPHVKLPTGEIRFIERDLWAWIESQKHPTREAARNG